MNKYSKWSKETLLNRVKFLRSKLIDLDSEILENYREGTEQRKGKPKVEGAGPGKLMKAVKREQDKLKVARRLARKAKLIRNEIDDIFDELRSRKDAAAKIS